MKVLLIFSLSLSVALGNDTNGKLSFPVLVTPSRAYTNARIERATPAEAIVFHDGGIAKVPMSNMPLVVQQKYNYSKQAADEFLQAEKTKSASAKAERTKQAEALRAAQKKIAYDSLVKVQPDKFLNVTIFETVEIPLSISLYCEAFCFTNAESTSPQNILLKLVSNTESWRFLDAHNLIVLYDGKRIDLGEIDHDGTVHGNSVLEQMTAKFSLEDFARIAFAQSVELRLGIKELKLTFQQRMPMRALVDRFAPPLTNEVAPVKVPRLSN